PCAPALPSRIYSEERLHRHGRRLQESVKQRRNQKSLSRRMIKGRCSSESITMHRPIFLRLADLFSAYSFRLLHDSGKDINFSRFHVKVPDMVLIVEVEKILMGNFKFACSGCLHAINKKESTQKNNDEKRQEHYNDEHCDE